jgi:hypothetical protein
VASKQPSGHGHDHEHEPHGLPRPVVLHRNPTWAVAGPRSPSPSPSLNVSKTKALSPKKNARMRQVLRKQFDELSQGTTKRCTCASARAYTHTHAHTHAHAGRKKRGGERGGEAGLLLSHTFPPCFQSINVFF